jgi:hypothetical protein
MILTNKFCSFVIMDQYFTPDISDLYIGYECEINYGVLPGISENWSPIILESFEAIVKYQQYGHNIFRTPHLTKEQIEAEGWKESDTPEFFDRIGNDRWFINWEPKFNWINIGDNESQYEYSGACPSINEFRKICKWLGITT